MGLEIGAKVALEYELSTSEEILEATAPGQRLEFVLGDGSLHPIIEKNLLGRKYGDDVDLVLDPSLAFGLRDERLAFSVSRKQLPAHLQETITPNARFEAWGPDRKQHLFRVLGVDQNRISIDGNHPLAGEIIYLKAKIF